MTLIIDSREPTSEIGQILMDISEYKLFPNFSIEALEYGDYYLENNGVIVYIERKSYSDYCGHINEQLKQRFFKMRQEAHFTCLILEGHPPRVDKYVYYYAPGGILMPSIQLNTYSNFMFSRGVDKTIILPTVDLKHTILTIAHIYDYIGQLDKKHLPPKANDSLELLAMLPGVGRKKSRELKKKYKNLFEAVKHAEDWMKPKDLERYKTGWD